MPKKKKSKKDKPPPNLRPEFVLDPKLEPRKGPRVKRAPDRPQPEWMFPPVEENPVLNPRPKSDEKVQKDKQDHDAAINFLQYKSVSTPVKDPPPPLLLTLIGGFLTSYGFNSTSRLYTTELASRKKLDEWKVLIDEKLPKGYPDLVKIYRDGHKVFEQRTVEDDTSSSESESDDDEEADAADQQDKQKKGKKDTKPGQTSGSGSEESSSEADSSDESASDVSMRDAPSNSKVVHPRKKRKTSHEGSMSASSSDDDEGPQTSGQQKSNGPSLGELVGNHSKSASTHIQSTATQDLLGKTPNAEEIDSDDSEDSSSESEEVDAPTQAATIASQSNRTENPSEIIGGVTEDKRNKQEDTKVATYKSASQNNSSSSESDSDSNSDSESASSPKTTGVSLVTQLVATKERTGSSSSETLQAVSTQKPSTANTSIPSTTSSDSDHSKWAPPEPIPLQGVTETTTTTTTKRKRSPSTKGPSSSTPAAASSKKPKTQFKEPSTPFQRVPKDTPVEERFSSNKYQSYDYADRAHQDLSVTKGKGFTKEKNKKKRGSYRGGMIDVSGGRAIKFE